MRTLLLLGATAGLIGVGDRVRSGPPAAPVAPEAPITAAALPIHVPFRVGERLTYAAKVNFMGAGEASMSVEDISTVRDHPTYHTIFDVKGRVLFFHVNDHYESW